MATACVLGVEQAVTLATTVTLITGIGRARRLIIYDTDVDLYLVTLTGTADGAALPSTGREMVKSTSGFPVELDIQGYGTIGLAGASSGTARVKFQN